MSKNYWEELEETLASKVEKLRACKIQAESNADNPATFGPILDQPGVKVEWTGQPKSLVDRLKEFRELLILEVTGESIKNNAHCNEVEDRLRIIDRLTALIRDIGREGGK